MCKHAKRSIEQLFAFVNKVLQERFRLCYDIKRFLYIPIFIVNLQEHMMLPHLLYRLIISPIEYILEIVFRLISHFFTTKTTLIGMSIVVSLLCLPLYIRADAIQQAEHDKQTAMDKWLKHIRATFTGDEKLMMINAFYREQNYRPASALKGTLSLVLQIPFFLAAYHFLSNLSVFAGTSAFGIADLSKPDALLQLGSLSVNVLPFMMTFINLLSGAVYTKGHPLREKMQIYILAAFFLVFLYDSPAALLIYWTMNNLFSLCKNVITKYSKDPKRILSIFISFLGILFVIQGIRKGKYRQSYFALEYGWLAFGILLPLLCQLPLLTRFLPKKKMSAASASSSVSPSHWPVALVLSIFMGALIPLSVISSSAQDFVDIYHYINPLHYVLTSTVIASGMFLVWGSVFYFLLPRDRRFAGFVIYLFLLCASMANFFFWGHNFGQLSSILTFHDNPVYPAFTKALNLFILIGILAATYLIARYFMKQLRMVCIILLLTILTVCGRYLYISVRDISAIDLSVGEKDTTEYPEIALSKTGKNVVVIMLDRAISGFIPYFFAEKSELYDMYDGFTYYPNTISFGQCTLYGAPALYGGYEYTPQAINSRTDESLQSKHNEALKVLPAIFANGGYHVFVADSPYANYSTIPDMTIYDDIPGVEAHNLEGSFSGDFEYILDTNQMERSFFFYSVFKTAPVLMQNYIYNSGDYLSLSGNTGDTQTFLNYYSVLTALPHMTKVSEDNTGTLLLMDNNTTHQPLYLDLPDYTPSYEQNGAPEDNTPRYSWDGKELNTTYPESMMHYHIDMASLLRLGEWFDELRRLGVYDNTRIILVADHGGLENNFGYPKIDFYFDLEKVNPLLLVKDFDAQGFNVSDEFMTNGDTPYLATKDLFVPAVNPYTGNELSMDGKNDVRITFSTEGTSNIRNQVGKNVFDCVNDKWFTVDGNIFDGGNWERVE